eukprot:187550-Rhodomonas_salina.2
MQRCPAWKRCLYESRSERRSLRTKKSNTSVGERFMQRLQFTSTVVSFQLVFSCVSRRKARCNSKLAGSTTESGARQSARGRVALFRFCAGGLSSSSAAAGFSSVEGCNSAIFAL